MKSYVLIPNDGWDKYLPQFDIIIIIYPTSTKSLKKAGRRIKTWFWASFCEKKKVLVNKTMFLMKQLRHNP